MTAPLIVVATPCFGGVVSQFYVTSLLGLAASSAHNNFNLQLLLWGNDSLITRARSTLVGYFLDDAKATHLLFVDADICFTAAQVVRMLNFDVDFVAGMYPAKLLDWKRISQLSYQGPESAQEAGLTYVGELCTGDDLQVKGGFATAMFAGNGFQLLKRELFEKMVLQYPDTHYKTIDTNLPTQSNNFYALFDPIIDTDGKYLSEDFAFCKRWRDIGGTIWLDTQSTLTHCGSYNYVGDTAKRFYQVKAGDNV